MGSSWRLISDFEAVKAERDQLRALLRQVLDASEDACGPCTKDPCPFCTVMERVQSVLLGGSDG